MQTDTATLTAAYDIGEEDILLLEQFTVAHNPVVRATLLRNQIAVSVGPVMAVILLSLILTRRLEPALFGIGLVLSGIFFGINRFGFEKALKKHLHKNVVKGMYANILGLNRMTLAENGVTVKAPIGESRIEWAHIAGVTMIAEGSLYLLLADGKSFIVPRRAFATDQDRQAFFDLASGYYKKAHEKVATA
jgi:hypothetical protein